MKDRSCSVCEYWLCLEEIKGEEDERLGECFRYPPSFPPDKISTHGFPVTAHFIQCGEWTKREIKS
jgi:hypothetical protein